MSVPLFKGEAAFDILDQRIDSMIAVAERQPAQEDDSAFGAAIYIGEGSDRFCLQDAEPSLLGDIRTRLAEKLEGGITRETMFETLVEALPGLNLPGHDGKKLQVAAENTAHNFSAVLRSDNARTLDEPERDVIRKVFNIVGEAKGERYNVNPQVMTWLGQVAAKLDRAFAETWQTAWTMAHASTEGGPAIEDVQGLEDRFKPPAPRQ